MIKTVIVGLVSFVVISGFLLWIGYKFDINWLNFSFYHETSDGFETGGSILPFIVGIIGSKLIGDAYQKRQQL